MASCSSGGRKTTSQNILVDQRGRLVKSKEINTKSITLTNLYSA
jgi:hypothetical protein